MSKLDFAISVSNLKKRYQNKEVLKNVSFSVLAGSIMLY